MALTLRSGEPTLHVLAASAASKQDKYPKIAFAASKMKAAGQGQHNQIVTTLSSSLYIFAGFG